MAKLKKQTLGNVSGKVGDLVFRLRKKTNYISHRPHKYNVPMDTDAIARRAKFSFTMKLVSTYLEIPELRQIWNPYVPNNRAIHNYIFSRLYPLVNSVSVNEQTIIVPKAGFIVGLDDVTTGNSVINVKTEVIGEFAGIDLNIEKKCEVVGVLSLSNPVADNVEVYELFALKSNLVDLSIDNPMNFEIVLNNQVYDLLAKYESKLMLFTLVTMDELYNLKNYSKTIYHRL